MRNGCWSRILRSNSKENLRLMRRKRYRVSWLKRLKRQNRDSRWTRERYKSGWKIKHGRAEAGSDNRTVRSRRVRDENRLSRWVERELSRIGWGNQWKSFGRRNNLRRQRTNLCRKVWRKMLKWESKIKLRLKSSLKNGCQASLDKILLRGSHQRLDEASRLRNCPRRTLPKLFTLTSQASLRTLKRTLACLSQHSQLLLAITLVSRRDQGTEEALTSVQVLWSNP